MSEIPFKISSVFGGWSISDYFNASGQFLSSIGIDPDFPSLDSGNKPCGYIRSTAMVKFSGTNVNATPMWILTNPKNALVYVILSNGRIISYNSSLAGETLVGTVTGGVATGAWYYDNYIYIARTADVARYGPLNGSPSLTQNYWTSTLSLTALTNTTYPTINGVKIPNHSMHKHTDGKLYFCDVLTSNKGILSYIKTKKTTVEGDTDDSSDHNALDFGYGQFPICVETYQTDLVVALIEGVGTSSMRGKISFWDTTSASFTSITSIETSETNEIITAIKNVNGTLFVFSGFITGGCRVSKLISGYSLEEVAYLSEEYPPISKGAVSHILNRVAWGSNTIEPAVAPAVFSWGSKQQKLPMGLHCIARATGDGANPMVTCVKYVSSDGKIVMPIIGWKDDSGYGLDKISTTHSTTSIWRSEVITPEFQGKKFMLKQLKIPFVQAMAENMILTVYVYGDNAVNDRTFTIDNSTRYSGKRQAIIYPEIEFETNVFFEIHHTGSALLTVALPILGVISTED